MGEMESFMSWFADNGGFLNDCAQVMEGSGSQRYVRIRPGHHIDDGDTILSCPHGLTFSYANHDRSDPRGYVSKVDPASSTQVIALRLMLMEHYLLGKDSFWWPYINTLHQPFHRHDIHEPDHVLLQPKYSSSTQLFHTPLYFDDEDMLWLKGTNLGGTAPQRASAWKEEFEQAKNAMKGLDKSKKHLWTSDLYIWASTIITSRSFSASALRIPGLDSPVLIPGVDLLNHSLSAKVTWDWGASTCCVQTNELLANGNQIFNNYGPKGNEELLMGYGFCIESNRADSFNLSYTRELSQHIEAVKARRVGSGHSEDQTKRGLIPPEDPLFPNLYVTDETSISPTSRAADTLLKDVKFVMFEKGDCEFCSGFLADCSLALQNARERNQDIHCSQSSTAFSNDRLSRNKLHTLSSIIMILQQKETEIRKHDINLPLSPRNKNQEYASIYRSSQLRILQGVLASLSTTLQSVTQLKFREQPRVVHLADILTKYPKALKPHFREVVHVGVRTRDVKKVIERKAVKFVFAIWLCGLRLLHQSGKLASSDPVLDRWIGFLRKCYDDRLINEVTRAGLRYGSLASNSDDVADTVRSYVNAIQVAVQRHPESVYNDDWARSQLNLTWCLVVVREEGVRCPTITDSGALGEEDEDEFVLVIDTEEREKMVDESNDEVEKLDCESTSH